MKIRAILLDMDDTLYDERDYVLSGFRVVAEAISRASGEMADNIIADLVETLERYGRGHVFDVVVPRYLPNSSEALITDLVTVYREHVPTIELYAGVRELLAELRRSFKLAVVTDGAAGMQRRKVAALGLESMVDSVVYCWEEQAPKPATAGFAVALSSLGILPSEAVILGDNPAHDMLAGKMLGCRTIRVRTGRLATSPTPPQATAWLELGSILEMEKILPLLSGPFPERNDLS